MNIKEVCLKALHKFGYAKQIDMAIEEMSELTKALCKNKRGFSNRLDIIEEIADVEIMIEQLKLLFNINNIEINVIKHDKLDRLIKLMKEG